MRKETVHECTKICGKQQSEKRLAVRENRGMLMTDMLWLSRVFALYC